MAVRENRTFRRLLWVAAVTVLITACAPGEEASEETGSTEVPDEIVIGATLPLTGEESSAGGYFKEGYELAFEEVTDAGGLQVGDKKVEVTLKLLDDTSDQATAVNLAERLITRDGVDFLLGTYSTSLVEAQSTVAEQNQIPYVNGGGAATSIYSRDYKWIFGALAPVELLGRTQMDWIAEQQEAGNLSEPAKIALLWENTSHGDDYRVGITEFAEQSGGAFEVVVDESFELDSKDFGALLSEVKSSDADLLLADAHLPDFVTMQRQYVSSDLCHEVITYGARGSERDAAKALGEENVAYILSAVWWHPLLVEQQSETNTEFIEIFKEKFGRDPEWYQALGYEAARALFTGIEEAESVDRETVRTALSELEMDSLVPGGKLSFPEESGNQAQYPFLVQQNIPGEGSPIVYPEELATGEGVAPNPECKG
jgi:branched-chain amino acid transport system substrate-binding protein